MPEDASDASVGARSGSAAVERQSHKRGESRTLPPWVVMDARLRWWSESQKKHMAVRVSKVDERKKIVVVTFVADKKVWKSVPFSFLGRKDCPLRNSEEGEMLAKEMGKEHGKETEKVTRGGESEVREGSRTPDWWTQERRKMIDREAQKRQRLAEEEKRKKEREEEALRMEEKRRQELIAAEKRKVEEAFERRKKEAEELKLKEEEEWRQNLRKRREQESQEEEEREREREEKRQKRRDEKEKRQKEEEAKNAKKNEALRKAQEAAEKERQRLQQEQAARQARAEQAKLGALAALAAQQQSLAAQPLATMPAMPGAMSAPTISAATMAGWNQLPNSMDRHVNASGWPTGWAGAEVVGAAPGSGGHVWTSGVGSGGGSQVGNLAATNSGLGMASGVPGLPGGLAGATIGGAGLAATASQRTGRGGCAWEVQGWGGAGDLGGAPGQSHGLLRGRSGVAAQFQRGAPTGCPQGGGSMGVWPGRPH